MKISFKLSTLATMAAVSTVLLVGCSAPTVETPPVKEAVEEAEPSTPATDEASEEAAAPETSPEGYQAIFDEYSARLIAECPNLAMTECAELSTDGVTKMAQYMYQAKGTDGQMATYEEWAGKLMDVYMSSVQ